MASFDVSIIIVSYNTADLLRQCIRSIQEKTTQVTYEIIIVDNASADHSAEMVRQEFPEIKLIASDQNLGFGAGNNAALPLVEGEYIFYLNPDTILLNDAVSILKKYLEANPKVGLVGPRLFRDEARTHHPTIRKFTTPKAVIGRHLPGFKHYQPLYEKYLVAKETTQRADWLMGAALMGLTTTLLEAGGFDEVYFVYSEEEDLCRRLLAKGKATHYVPDAEVVHLWGASSKLSPSISNRFFWDSLMIYLYRYYPKSTVQRFIRQFSLLLTIKGMLGDKDRKEYFNQIKSIINEPEENHHRGNRS